jgi:phosphoribosylformylglycinamidine synthase
MVLAAPGTNRDHDAAFALELAGAAPRVTLLAELAATPALLDEVQMLVVAGGFSYADALGAGRLWALELVHVVGEALTMFVARGRPVIGICNGFQVLTRAGLLPGALGHNASGAFQCEWVTLAPQAASTCLWTRSLDPIDCPIAHGEGRYAHPDPAALDAAGQVALRYQGRNPNGSVADIAGVCNPAGNVLGLMPHPENHVVARQHPRHRRGVTGGLGLALFEQGVRHAREQ